MTHVACPRVTTPEQHTDSGACLHAPDPVTACCRAMVLVRMYPSPSLRMLLQGKGVCPLAYPVQLTTCLDIIKYQVGQSSTVCACVNASRNAQQGSEASILCSPLHALHKLHACAHSCATRFTEAPNPRYTSRPSGKVTIHSSGIQASKIFWAQGVHAYSVMQEVSATHQSRQNTG